MILGHPRLSQVDHEKLRLDRAHELLRAVWNQDVPEWTQEYDNEPTRESTATEIMAHEENTRQHAMQDAYRDMLVYGTGYVRVGDDTYRMEHTPQGNEFYGPVIADMLGDDGEFNYNHPRLHDST